MAGPASAQFLDELSGPATQKDWTYFTGDGSATIDFRQGDGCGTILVDATRDRANIWWALIKRNVAPSGPHRCTSALVAFRGVRCQNRG
jgi:hypothetical protein